MDYQRNNNFQKTVKDWRRYQDDQFWEHRGTWYMESDDIVFVDSLFQCPVSNKTRNERYFFFKEEWTCDKNYARMAMNNLKHWRPVEVKAEEHKEICEQGHRDLQACMGRVRACIKYTT